LGALSRQEQHPRGANELAGDGGTSPQRLSGKLEFAMDQRSALVRMISALQPVRTHRRGATGSKGRRTGNAACHIGEMAGSIRYDHGRGRSRTSADDQPDEKIHRGMLPIVVTLSGTVHSVKSSLCDWRHCGFCAGGHGMKI